MQSCLNSFDSVAGSTDLGCLCLCLLLSLLLAKLHTIVLLVPLLERSSIDLHNGVLHQGLGTHLT